jgi:N4-gp56 family major capsid protein
MSGMQRYQDPAGGTPSSVGSQMNTFYYEKKALIEIVKEQYFSQLADATSMPKNMGKKIKKYHYLPLLDDRNVNDQGIDAAGATIANGNLYGSSKDVGTISGKLPALSENGGRVNRVGFKRVEIEGTLEKFGFFDEYTQESLDFDSDADLQMHVTREMLRGANEITEDALQIDLLNSAGVLKYAGNAVSKVTVGADDVVDYGDLMRVSIDLDNNRTPKQTTVITGSRLVDTRTVPSARIAYCGSELLPTFKAMKDLHDQPAWIPVEKYAAGGTPVRGEQGAIDALRIVVVPEMMKWAGAGADASASPDYYATAGKFDVFPILVVGDESFTTIGFQTDGKTVKFKITHKKPGDETADRNDPYGETGFMSIKWYYGFLCLRPERIALVLTAAKM